MTSEELLTFSHEHVLAQLKQAEFRHGYYVLKFFSDEKGRPSNQRSAEVSDFFLYPSGGTMRDKNFQLLFYDSRYDTYRGFQPPTRIQ